MKVFSFRATETPLNLERVMVKNWTFRGNGNAAIILVYSHGNLFPTFMTYTHTVAFTSPLPILPGLAVPGSILPAQGNNNTPPAFNGHWITRVSGNYYDPSYGSAKVSTANGADYENAAFSGYFTNDSNLYARKNESACDVIYVED